MVGSIVSYRNRYCLGVININSSRNVLPYYPVVPSHIRHSFEIYRHQQGRHVIVRYFTVQVPADPKSDVFGSEALSVSFFANDQGRVHFLAPDLLGHRPRWRRRFTALNPRGIPEVA